MSMTCGAGGVFGLLLSEHHQIPAVRILLDELNKYVDEGDNEGTWLDKNYSDPDDDPTVKAFVSRFVQAFAEAGIVIPEGAALLWTGDDDERPATCDCPGEEFTLGFGLFVNPSKYPAMDKSFLDIAQWHTWAWMA